MKVEFMPGIESVSGSLKQKNGNRLVFTHRRSDKSGQGRLYLRHASDYQRSTPVSDKELANRQRLARISLMAKNLSEEQKKAYLEDWSRNHFFNGKEYATPRGYIIARLNSEFPNG